MKNFKIISHILLLFCGIQGISQETQDNDNEIPVDFVQKKGLRLGLFVGSYFANQYTAGMYDGYGFDIDGNKNGWDNSLMNQKINMQYGGYGYSGQIDQIATALNVDYHTWTFSQSDMPMNMRYSPSFAVGLNCIYSVDKNNAILLNLNAAKLNIGGNFTIITPQQTGSSQINNRIKTFAIKGGEQRLMFQFGYQRILGDNEKLNFFVEGGLHVTITKYDKNEILINSLKIDLTSYYNQAAYSSAVLLKKPIGTGFGVFAGFGANITMNPKFTIQLLYSPTYEKINIGINPRLKLQNAVGLRAYYNF
ncbi:MAG: hypothetical protein Q7W13_00245 [Bacteroidia bacterium]|nr:hypothetical protein [Bacteroidia bacterium]